MPDLSMIVESVHGDDREEIGRAADEKSAWVMRVFTAGSLPSAVFQKIGWAMW